MNPSTSTFTDINTGGLFSSFKVETETKAVEALLQRIIQTVEKNERELTTQRSNFESSQMHLNQELKRMQHQISSLEIQSNSSNARIDKIEQAIQVSGVHMTVGESVLSNRKTLVRTLNLLSNKADSEELKELVQDQEQKLDARVEELKMDLASNAVIQKMNEANSALVARIDVLSDDLRNKVDKSFFKVLSSEAASLHNYAEFVKKTESILKVLEDTLEKVNHTMEEQDERTKSLSDQTNQTIRDVRNCPSFSDLKQVANNLETVSQSIESKVDKEELSDLHHKQNASIEDRIQSCQDDTKTLFASHETLAKYLTKRISGTYTKSEVDQHIVQCLDKETFVDEVQKINENVESKATFHALHQLHQALEAFQRDMNLTKKKADLAAQFIALYNKD